MNRDYLPLLVLVLLIPCIISPVTVEGFSIKNEEQNLLDNFKSPMNIIQWKNIFSADIVNIIKDESQLWTQQNTFVFQPYLTITQLFENTINDLENFLKIFTIPQATAQVSKEVSFVHQKVVMIFDSSLSEKELRDIIDTQIVPLIESDLNSKFIDISAKLYDNEYKLSQTDQGHWEFYPDYNIKGDTTLEDAQITTNLDASTDSIQTILTNSVDLLKATDIRFDTNKSTATVETKTPILDFFGVIVG